MQRSLLLLAFVCFTASVVLRGSREVVRAYKVILKMTRCVFSGFITGRTKNP